MSVILGIAGASRNAALALCDGGRIVGVCEHARVTRTRRAALKPGELPKETLQTMLLLGACSEQDISAYAVAETSIHLPPERPVAYVDHHHAHAATAFYSSPFTDATIVVCDRGGRSELTVWRGDQTGLRQETFPWVGPAFASVYSKAAEAMGFGGGGDEHRLEALARVGQHQCDAALPTIAYRGDHLDVPSHFQASIAGIIGRNGSSASGAQRASLAEQVQRQVGDLLLQAVSDISRRFGGSRLCLGGGLFYNSYFTTLLAESGLYVDTFVPPNPGNAGVAVGAALAIAAGEMPLPRQHPLSAFLGPEFTPQQIKAILDNCKLSYDYLRDGQIIERTTAALAKGQLAGWFQGRMEWGPRALGNRSILASPIAPYVLENLNVFLKQRAPHETYSIAICTEDLPRYFRGPARSSFMEYEYEVLDRELLRQLLPANTTRLRVQTVDESAGTFYELIRAFGDRTGVPMLVNTSFNGFNEPIVCSPRDAIRVFYGTGLDMAVLGGLVLRK
jgi:carbamoyltransferase